MNKYFEPKKPIRYMTSDIEESLPAHIKSFLWECIDAINKDSTTDYLTIFKLYTNRTNTGELMQFIEHSQENPPYRKIYIMKAISGEVNDIVYIIDNITQITMLYAKEYLEEGDH